MSVPGNVIPVPPGPSGWAQVRGAFKSYLGSSVHQSGMRWTKDLFGIGQKGLGKWMAGGFLGYSLYQGYREGGAWGAVAGGTQAVAETYAFGAGLNLAGKLLGTTPGPLATLGLGAVTIGGTLGMMQYAATGVTPWQFLARPYVRDHMRKHAKLEMGAPVVDQFGSLATMRQRSVAAIQSSHINARSALGHEAMSLYRPYGSIVR